MILCLLIASAGCASAPRARPEAHDPTVPYADFHTHLFTEAAIARVYPEPLPSVVLPTALAQLLATRAERWNTAATFGELYSDSGFVLEARGGTWRKGNTAVAEYLTGLFAVPHYITPVAYSVSGRRGHIAGYYSRSTPAGVRHFGHVLLALEQGSDSAWRIAAETPSFPGPKVPRAYTADQLIAQLDTAGIQRALVLSTSYWFQSGRGAPVDDEVGRVRAEHDWLAREVARYSGRLIAFCSLNPLRPYALDEMRRCAAGGMLRGVKLHLGDSQIDMLNPAHVAAARQLFAEANALRLPLMVHVMTGAENYGRAHSRIFLDSLVGAAPDIPIQIAHLAGSGPGYWNVDSALAVFAEAAAGGDPLMRNVYLDVATIVTLDERPATLAQIASRIRQLGVHRVLFASDYPASPELTPRQLWAAFRLLPLTDAEFRTIAGNRTPYLR